MGKGESSELVWTWCLIAAFQQFPSLGHVPSSFKSSTLLLTFIFERPNTVMAANSPGSTCQPHSWSVASQCKKAVVATGVRRLLKGQEEWRQCAESNGSGSILNVSKVSINSVIV